MVKNKELKDHEKEKEVEKGIENEKNEKEKKIYIWVFETSMDEMDQIERSAEKSESSNKTLQDQRRSLKLAIQ